MPKQFWLLKSDPETYSYPDLVKDGSTYWDGVRNYQARNNLKKMRKGDTAFIYHSQEEKTIVGLVQVTKEFYQDPTDKTGEWVVVELEAKKTAKKPVSLETIKKDPLLKTMLLVTQSRLSVMPVTEAQASRILEVGF